MRVFAAADRDGQFQVMPGGLARRRASAAKEKHRLGGRGERYRRTNRRLDREARTYGSSPIGRFPRSRFCVRRPRRWNSGGAATTCPAAWPTTCIGSAVTSSEQTAWSVTFARWSCGMTSELEPSNLPELKVLVQMLADDARPVVELPSDSEDLVRASKRRSSRASCMSRRSGTLDETLRSLYRTAALVRDRISADTWRIVNQLDLDLLAPRPTNMVRLGDTLSVLNQVFNLLSALSGLMTESMTRGPGWRFVDMGRRLERGLTVLRLLRKTLVHSPAESISLMESVLEIADSAMTYRYRYLTSLQLAPLLDLLLTDETNPRSLGYQLGALADHVRQLPGKDTNPLRNREHAHHDRHAGRIEIGRRGSPRAAARGGRSLDLGQLSRGHDLAALAAIRQPHADLFHPHWAFAAIGRHFAG